MSLFGGSYESEGTLIDKDGNTIPAVASKDAARRRKDRSRLVHTAVWAVEGCHEDEL